ncbi:hypothetical protein [Parabacteroides sp. Marseille-P3160]|uniref:hypothetical protein n=1 Tax=Parabacteroides sp. Marseille-P3160 TaxID=1917887 RepID=UPI0009BAA608|nr:hypothetical protein [Parabacteroides sp. Marseille-P3160]
MFGGSIDMGHARALIPDLNSCYVRRKLQLPSVIKARLPPRNDYPFLKIGKAEALLPTRRSEDIPNKWGKFALIIIYQYFGRFNIIIYYFF